MGAPDVQYRWWLLDRDLKIVSDGNVSGRSLPAALADLSHELDRLSDRAHRGSQRPYSLIVYRGADVVAWRPSTLGVC